jgi:hypothetical protein
VTTFRCITSCHSWQLVGSTPLFDEGVYDWSRVPDCYLIEGARSLVGALLVQASNRLGPDKIVMHPFIANGSYTFRTSVLLDPGQVRDAALLLTGQVPTTETH